MKTLTQNFVSSLGLTVLLCGAGKPSHLDLSEQHLEYKEVAEILPL